MLVINGETRIPVEGGGGERSKDNKNKSYVIFSKLIDIINKSINNSNYHKKIY